MKKQLCLSILALSLYVCPAFAQGQSISTPKESLYSMSLFATLEQMDKSWGDRQENPRDNYGRANYKNMVVQQDLNITDGLPSQHGEYRVEYLDSEALIDRYKRLKKAFPVIVVYPMKNEGTMLKIGFNLYWVSYKNGRFLYALSDWSHVFLRYDREKEVYTIDQIKLGGV